MSSTKFTNKIGAFVAACVVCCAGCAVHTQAAPVTPAALSDQLRIAVLPMDNLSRQRAPVNEMRQALIQGIAVQGAPVIGQAELELFMARHRVRYVGGLDTVTAQAFKDEMGVEAVLITSLELYDTAFPPKISLTSRLVSTGKMPRILWMESVAMAGDDSRGVLGLGLIADPNKLHDKAIKFLLASLAGSLEEESRESRRERKTLRPKIVYRSPLAGGDLRENFVSFMQKRSSGDEGQNTIPEPGVSFTSESRLVKENAGAAVSDKDAQPTLAVIPFSNRSDSKNAGEILALHFMTQLAKSGVFNVVEPGIIRQKLLNARIIMREGPSFKDMDYIFNTLDADLIFTGKVLDYQNYSGPAGKPKADFIVSVLERRSRKTIWMSRSANEGDDGVFFFDWGRISVVEALASKMAKAIIRSMTTEN